MLRESKFKQIIDSEGANEKLHLEEGGNFMVSEGATLVAGHMNTHTEKYLSNIVKQNIETSKRRK